MTYPPQQHPPQPYPAQPWQAPDPGSPPTSIRAVFWIVVVQSVLGLVVGLPLAYLSKDAILAAQPETPGVDPEAIWQAGFAFGVVIALASSAMWLLFAVKLRQGRNWARITMLVLGCISLALMPFNLTNSAAVTAYTLVPALVGAVVNAVVVILLFMEPAKSWTPAKTAYLKSNTPF